MSLKIERENVKVAIRFDLKDFISKSKTLNKVSYSYFNLSRTSINPDVQYLILTDYLREALKKKKH